MTDKPKTTSDGDGAEKIDVKVASQQKSTPAAPSEQTAGSPVHNIAPPPEMGVHKESGMSELDAPLAATQQSASDESAVQVGEGAESNLAPVATPPDNKPLARAVNEQPNPGSEAASESDSKEPSSDKPGHHNNKKLAALVTIFVGAILAGVVVFVYVSTEKNTEQSATTTQTPTQTEQTQQDQPINTEPATEQDIDTVSNDIDEAIKAIDDDADFSEEDLSDETLGL